SNEVQLLFEDSWYWLHYRFFGCRDFIASESSAAIRTHLYNLVAMIYRGFDEFISATRLSSEAIHALIKEVVEIAEYARQLPIWLRIYRDETSKDLLDERISPLPSIEQIEYLMNLHHFRRMETERYHYRFISEELAVSRYRNELAAFNKRRKLQAKNAQRE